MSEDVKEASANVDGDDTSYIKGISEGERGSNTNEKNLCEKKTNSAASSAASSDLEVLGQAGTDESVDGNIRKGGDESSSTFKAKADDGHASAFGSLRITDDEPLTCSLPPKYRYDDEYHYQLLREMQRQCTEKTVWGEPGPPLEQVRIVKAGPDSKHPNEPTLSSTLELYDDTSRVIPNPCSQFYNNFYTI